MTAAAERPSTTIFKRPRSTTGIWSWITTVDHKRIGIMYGYAAFFFFIIGGVEALLLRIHLAQANSEFLTAGAYNALFTMHGTTMIFLFVMPVSSAFINYLLPLLLGARDVAFPRLNALSWWLFFFGGIFLYSTFIFGTSLAPVGVDGVGGNLAGTLLLPADHPTNPFKHKYHPDHDNLNERFDGPAEESFDVTRQIALDFAAAPPPGRASLDFGYNEMAGTYRETITGIHKNALQLEGTFFLRRLSTIAELNPAPNP